MAKPSAEHPATAPSSVFQCAPARVKTMMRKLLQSMFALFAVAEDSLIETKASALEIAFQQSRATKNIEVLFKAYVQARLYVVTGSRARADDYFLLPAPNQERFCVTVSECVRNLKNINLPKVEVTGEALIKALPYGVDVVVVYPDGADHLSSAHLQWYRNLIKQAVP